MSRVILNPYGIAYTLGLTARPNPNPLSLWQFIDLANQINASGIELFTPMADAIDLAKLAAKLAGKTIVLSQPLWTGITRSIEVARKLNAKTIRMHLTGILCGDRADPNCKWNETVVNVKRMLADAAPRAAEFGLSLAIENHQDFTSTELVDLCQTTAPNIGICLDTGNALSVGEDPITFAKTIANCCKHVHLKDYQVQWTPEGYRLIRCPLGDGVIPFPQILEIFKDKPVTLALEIGALTARHIRLLTANWWTHYPPRSAESLASALRAARIKTLPEHEDHRTPFEKESPPNEIVNYELSQLHRSVAYLQKLNLIQEPHGQ